MIFERFSLYFCNIPPQDYYVRKFCLPVVTDIIKIIHIFKNILYFEDFMHNIYLSSTFPSGLSHSPHKMVPSQIHVIFKNSQLNPSSILIGVRPTTGAQEIY